MATETEAKNPLSLSDEDFLKQGYPAPEVKDESEQEEKDPNQEKDNGEGDNGAGNQEDTTTKEEPNKSDEVKSDNGDSQKEVDSGNVSANADAQKDGKGKTSVSTDSSTAAAVNKDGTQKKEGDKSATSDMDTSKVATTTTVNYEQEYKRLMAPFKANGKMIEVRSPDELIQLAQMGANYTRKMQELQPHRKTLLMLENNGLMDQDKLAFLIDLDKGNPEAIKKLLKDKGVDPLSINTEEAPNYLGGNHKVSDEEANFRTVLDDVSSNPEGKVTLHTVNSTWDQASKEMLWKEPGLLQVIHQQRETGIYDAITTELDRLKTLGHIPAGTPFIQAYKAVGDMMQEQGKLAPKVGAGTTATSVVAEPVATRVAAVKSTVTNGDQASAAAAVRTSPKKVEKVSNPLAMSDDDFLKQMAHRV